MTDANINKGIDGCNLPYGDNSFDVAVSVNTIEHVKNKVKFFQESIRVAKNLVIHHILFGEDSQEVEALKKKFGHNHPNTPISQSDIDDGLKGYEYIIEDALTCREHLFLICTITPRCNCIEIHEALESFRGKRYSLTLIVDLNKGK